MYTVVLPASDGNSSGLLDARLCFVLSVMVSRALINDSLEMKITSDKNVTGENIFNC